MASARTNGVDTGFVALGYGKVVLLGIVQGITELLPMPSTAHMMPLAALAAVVSYFWGDVNQLVRNSLRAVARSDLRDRHFRFSIWIVLATVPMGPVFVRMPNICGSPLRTLTVVGRACGIERTGAPKISVVKRDGQDTPV